MVSFVLYACTSVSKVEEGVSTFEVEGGSVLGLRSTLGPGLYVQRGCRLRVSLYSPQDTQTPLSSQDVPGCAIQPLLIFAPLDANLARIEVLGVDAVSTVHPTLTVVPGWSHEGRQNIWFHSYTGENGPAPDVDIEQNLLNLRRIAQRMDIDRLTLPTLHYWRYADAAEKERVFGRGGNGHFDGAQGIHTIWPNDTHETAHFIAHHAWGKTRHPVLLEGLAVLMSGGWQGYPLSAWKQKGLPNLEDLLYRFRSLDDMVSYPAAGLWVRALRRECGHDAFRAIYTTHEALPDAVQRHCDKPLTEVSYPGPRSVW